MRVATVGYDGFEYGAQVTPGREGDALVRDNADEADCEAASESEGD